MANSTQAISDLNQTIGSFKSKVDVKINSVNTSTSNIKVTTDRIYENINKFKSDMMKNEEKQIAHENILRIDQIIKEQFGDHETIRRTVMGVVRDFDINLVRNSTIQELSEELWITSSRYWLSYALIAITAWVNDYQDVAQNALSECGRRDNIKTTLFFCLMNLRFNRVEPAKQWFFEYLNVLNPAVLQQETAILLQAFLNGIFGTDKELENEIVKLIDEWVKAIDKDEDISEELVSAYEQYIENNKALVEFDYEAINNFCENSQELKKVFLDVSKYEMLIDFVKSLDVEFEAHNKSNYKSRIDAILKNLISNYDAEELLLKNQQQYYRYIIDNNGVIEDAEAQYKAMQELQNEHFNIGKQMVTWALYDDSNQTNVHVRKFGLQNTKLWFKMAVDNWTSRMEEAFPLEYTLKIDTWRSVSNGADQGEQIESLKQYFKRNKFRIKYINSYNIAAFIAFLISISLIFVSIYSCIGAILSIAFLVYRVIKANRAFPIRLNAAMENLNKCMTEISDFVQYYEESRVKKDKLISMVEFL